MKITTMVLKKQESFGFALALTGFAYLLLPGASAPPLIPALLMVLSGVSWGIYSLIGQSANDSTGSTAQNFLFSLPLFLLTLPFFDFNITHQGFLLAFISGALTSGLGYILWYVVLKKLKTSTAAILQLSVPAIAAFGGVLFLNEHISSQLIVSSVFIFSGIFLKVFSPAESQDL